MQLKETTTAFSVIAVISDPLMSAIAAILNQSRSNRNSLKSN